MLTYCADQSPSCFLKLHHRQLLSVLRFLQPCDSDCFKEPTLAGLDYLRPDYERLQQVDTVQCIWRQAASHTREFEDSKLQNWQMGAKMSTVYEQMLFPDATLVVRGQRLPAHRAVLAAASPVFLRMFSSPMQEGSPC